MTAPDHSYETSGDRPGLAREAGLGKLSLPSVLAGVLVAAVGAVAASQADAEAIRGNLRSVGIPTTSTEWGNIGTLAGIASLAAMLVGTLPDGMLGERWHSKLTRRAVSGKYRPATTHRSDPHRGDPHRPGPVATSGRPRAIQLAATTTRWITPAMRLVDRSIHQH